MRRSVFVQVSGACLLAWSATSSLCWGQNWIVKQLTDNDQYDVLPRVKNDRVAWTKYQGGTAWRPIFDLMYYDGYQTHQLTHGDAYVLDPQISDSTIRWTRAESAQDWGPHGKDLMYYDGTTITNLSDFIDTPYTEEQSPCLEGRRVVWESGFRGNDSSFEIYSYDGVSFERVTNNEWGDFYPRLSGPSLVWYGSDGSDYEILRNESGQTVAMTENELNDRFPRVSGSNIAWTQYVGDQQQLLFTNGATTRYLKNNGEQLVYSQMHGSTVAWLQRPGSSDEELYVFDGFDTYRLTNDAFRMNSTSFDVVDGRVVYVNQLAAGGNREVFLYDGVTTRQITNNSLYTNSSPWISEEVIAWLGTAGTITSLFAFDGAEVLQLSEPGMNVIRFHLDGRSITWEADDGNDTEIFFAMLVPEPAGLALMLPGLVLLGRCRRRR